MLFRFGNLALGGGAHRKIRMSGRLRTEAIMSMIYSVPTKTWYGFVSCISCAVLIPNISLSNRGGEETFGNFVAIYIEVTSLVIF